MILSVGIGKDDRRENGKKEKSLLALGRPERHRRRTVKFDAPETTRCDGQKKKSRHEKEKRGCGGRATATLEVEHEVPLTTGRHRERSVLRKAGDMRC